MIIAIIQARMGSTRFPGKVMKDLCGKPVLWHVVNRVSYAKLINQFVVATTTNKEDDVIAEFCKSKKINVFRGSSEDVLSRYCNCAKSICGEGGGHYIVRITADCPLIDPVEIDKVIQLAIDRHLDYASNTHPITYPDGLDTEIFTVKALSDAHQNAKLPSEREHVTPYIINNPCTRQGNIVCPKDFSNLPQMRWTLDYETDYTFIKAIYQELYRKENGKGCFLMDDILQLLKEKPELMGINSHIPANEGYTKSLEEDKKFLERKRSGTTKKIPVIDFKSPSTYTTMRPEEWKELQRKAIKIWHFEKNPDGKGVHPVAGEYDPTNPNHVHRKKVYNEFYC